MLGNALEAASVQPALDEATTLVHLTGAPKPAPWKGKQFPAVGQVSLNASLEAARRAGIAHLVYVSVAHPAPVMRAYIAVRRECEQAIRNSGLSATILRPWYVLGEAHWWPLGLLPFYRLAEAFPPSRPAALRLGLLWRDEMVRGLIWAVENRPASNPAVRILSVPDIRALAAEKEPSPVQGEGIRKTSHVSLGD
jgi:uncharacterized protein YbjT (DUF2867 family)